MEPLISIIVPVYNVEKYLARCIDSILAQTYTKLEIILVDDGSPDSCGQICDVYAEKDSRIQVIHKENGGVASARNVGLERCSGEYLMFVDPDDYISCDAVQVMYERLIFDGSDLVIGKHADVYEDGSENDEFCSWMEDAIIYPSDIYQKLKDKEYYPVSNSVKMYRRKLFNRVVYPPLCCGEDVWVFPQIIEQCEKISVVNKTVYFYFQRSDSLLHQKSERAKQDDVSAVLHLVAFLQGRGFEKSASRWYGIGIDKSLALKCKQDGLKLFKEYFDAAERRKLLRAQRMKTKLKWVFCIFRSCMP